MKTLKDFEYDIEHCNGCEGDYPDCSFRLVLKEMREDAKKWVNQDNIQELFLSGRVDLLPETRDMIGEGIKKWIEHFFNLNDAVYTEGVKDENN